MDKNLTDAKILSYSIADAIDSLYLYSTMQANCGNLDDWNRITGTMISIHATAEYLTKILADLEKAYENSYIVNL